MPEVTPVDPTAQLLIEEEGEVLHVYKDSMGYDTIGVGRLVDASKGGKIAQAESRFLLANDMRTARMFAAQLQGYAALNLVQKAAVESMLFQLGPEGVSKFTSFRTLLGAGNAVSAAKAGLESKWAQQDTPARAQREMKMLATGVWVPKS